MSRQTREDLEERLVYEVRAAQTATDAVDELAGKILGVNRTDNRCLDILDRDGPMTAGALAAAASLTPGAMTTVLDRLERAGFARRIRDEQDRRRVLVEITADAREQGHAIYAPLKEMSEGLFAKYSDADLELICRFLRDNVEINDALAARLRERLERE